MSADQTSGANPKKPKTRSPNHPVVGLEDAIKLAEAIQKTYGTHEVPLNLAHKTWKYKEWSSVADQCVAALKSYGLIKVSGKGKGRKMLLTDAGDRITRNAPDREALIRNAATAPALHREIIAHFGAKGLPVDTLLSQYLVWERPEGQRFNEDTVGAFIARFRKTLEFSKATASDIIGESPDADDEDGTEDLEGHEAGGGDFKGDPRKTIKRRQMAPGLKEDVFSLDQGVISVQWPERIQGADEDDIDSFLKTVKKKLKRALDAGSESEDEPSDDE